MAAANDQGSVSLDRASRSVVGAAADRDGPGAFAATSAPGDPLGRALRAVRLTGALFFVVDASSPWCVDIPPMDAYARILLPGAPHVLSYHIVVEGSGWAKAPGVEPTRIEAGDVIVFPHGDPYVLESAPGTPPELDREQTLAFFRAMAAGELPFVVTEGGGVAPPARFICGFLGCRARPFNPILAGLPRMLRLRRPRAGQGDLLDRLIDLTLDEARQNRAGGDSVKLRLSELLFIELLRQYAASPDPKPPGWMAGLKDPAVARALEALHERPAERWTVASLARTVGVSRSRLAARFAEATGHSPMRYLALWRLQLAAGLLSDGAAPVAAIAHEVGYGSEAAFSRSFKKLVGVSPEAWRRGGDRHGG